MSRGPFAEWQPRYAEHGIATFPVRGKKPAIKGYLRLDVTGSSQLVEPFGNESAFGFAAQQSGIVVVDVDTPDERVLSDALDRHGHTPIIVRSGGGKFHAWYRRRNEGRSIRPDPALPIDILGRGIVVVPPSLGEKGKYQIVQGSLADVPDLPFLRNAPSVSGLTSSAVVQGSRNDALWRTCMKQARFCDDLEALIDVARTTNSSFMPPLTDVEVVKAARSAWGYMERGENWFETGKRVVATHAEIDGLMLANSDAFILLMLLRRQHWGRDFAVANALAEHMPGGGWTRKRLAAARHYLEETGEIEMISPASRQLGAASYRLKAAA